MNPTSAILFLSLFLFNLMQCQRTRRPRPTLEFWWSQDDAVSTYIADSRGRINPMDQNCNGQACVNHPSGSLSHATVRVPSSTFYIAIAATNKGTSFKDNAAGFILSNSLMSGNKPIQTDDTWKCKGYNSTDDYLVWPAQKETQNLIRKGIKEHTEWDDAFSTFANNNYEFPGYVENIALNARWIWAKGGYGPKNPPPFKVICIKEFDF